MTKPIIVVKMLCKISFLSHRNTKVLSSWPSLISDVLVAYNFASDWPRTFYSQAFLFRISLSLCTRTYIQLATTTDVVIIMCYSPNNIPCRYIIYVYNYSYLIGFSLAFPQVQNQDKHVAKDLYLTRV